MPEDAFGVFGGFGGGGDALLACVAGRFGAGVGCLGGVIWCDFAGHGGAKFGLAEGGRCVGEVGVRGVFGAGVVQLVGWRPAGAGDPDAVSCGRFPGRGFEGLRGAGGVAVVVPVLFRAGFEGCRAVVEGSLLFLVDAGFALDQLYPCTGFFGAAGLEVEVPRR